MENKRELKMSSHNVKCRENYKIYYNSNPEVKQKKTLNYYVNKLDLKDDFFTDCHDIEAKIKKARIYNHEQKIELLNL